MTKYNNKQISKKEDVEELTNSVFLSFAEQYHNIVNISHWMRRVLFISFVRWYKKYKIRKLSTKTQSYFKRGDNGKSSGDDILTILKVLNTFSEEKQKIIQLKLWANLTFKQIGENLKKNEAEVIKIFHSTLLSIKNRLR